jgi:hypothetical protein
MPRPLIAAAPYRACASRRRTLSLTVSALLLCALGCHSKRIPIHAPPIIEQERWAAREVTPDTYLVAVRDGQGEKEALAYLCPKNAYLCTVEPVGRLVQIQRKRK